MAVRGMGLLAFRGLGKSCARPHVVGIAVVSGPCVSQPSRSWYGGGRWRVWGNLLCRLYGCGVLEVGTEEVGGDLNVLRTAFALD
jgi:hypothetical protein